MLRFGFGHTIERKGLPSIDGKATEGIIASTTLEDLETKVVDKDEYKNKVETGKIKLKES